MHQIFILNIRFGIYVTKGRTMLTVNRAKTAYKYHCGKAICGGLYHHTERAGSFLHRTPERAMVYPSASGIDLPYHISYWGISYSGHAHI